MVWNFAGGAKVSCGEETGTEEDWGSGNDERGKAPSTRRDEEEDGPDVEGGGAGGEDQGGE